MAVVFRERSRQRVLTLLLGWQVVAILIAQFVPFGFDHPSSLGLDFDHFLIVAALYLVALLWGLVLAGLLRRWGLFVGQIVIPCGLVLLSLAGVA